MKKVLIVEDDPMLSEIYQKKFEKSGNFEVIRATSGFEAQEKAKKEKPDLILLDLVLPEMDGFDVIKEIRKDSSLDNIKIIPFSNLSQEDNKKKLKELGIDGFISKSEHTPAQLINEVEKILKNGEKKIVSKINIQEIPKTEKFSIEDQKRILIIEDEEAFLEIFGNKLIESGYEVEKAFSGKEGLDLLMQKNFGLIIIDIILPDSEAIKIIMEFKTKFPKSKTKFVVLKNEADSEKELDNLRKTGIQALVDKDKISPEDFVSEINKLLE